MQPCSAAAAQQQGPDDPRQPVGDGAGGEDGSYGGQ